MLSKLLSRFRKKKEEIKTEVKPEERSLLEQLCGKDMALYEDLARSMYLDPRGKGTYEEAMASAEEVERGGNKLRARAKYICAGGLALYEANVNGVKKAFSKVAELGGWRYERLREVPEKAIQIVQEYYKRELKPLEEKN
jgi:hypothetical protein